MIRIVLAVVAFLVLSPGVPLAAQRIHALTEDPQFGSVPGAKVKMREAPVVQGRSRQQEVSGHGIDVTARSVTVDNAVLHASIIDRRSGCTARVDGVCMGQIVVQLRAQPGLQPGLRQVTVHFVDGHRESFPVRVLRNGQITSVTPSQVRYGRDTTFVITGSNLQSAVVLRESYLPEYTILSSTATRIEIRAKPSCARRFLLGDSQPYGGRYPYPGGQYDVTDCPAQPMRQPVTLSGGHCGYDEHGRQVQCRRR